MTIDYAKESQDPRLFQIIDANLDRAREGLRVLEDWCRFGLGREDLVKKFKNFRQILGKHHLEIYKKSRNYVIDNSIGMSHPEQFKRKEIKQLISSNAARVQEALRVVEEFSRIYDYSLSQNASKIRYEIYSLEVEILEIISNKILRKILDENNLYVISKDEPNIINLLKAALEGGARIIQQRCKSENDYEILQQALEIRQLCNKFKAIFIVNDRVDIALASNADGVHLGQSDIDIKSARKLLGFSKIIGTSANNAADINKAIKEGCDYLGIGPIFKSSTKPNKSVIGIREVIELSKDIEIPCFAIGGINSKNIQELKNIGIKKVAIISGIINADNPKEEAMMIIKTLSDEAKS